MDIVVSTRVETVISRAEGSEGRLLAKAKGQNPKLLAYHKTAITISATILVICMFSLLFAQHPAIQSIGFASLVGMISTMLLAYTLEPWLFRLCLKSNFLRQRILK